MSLHTLFAPNYSSATPYQKYLADELKKIDVEVSFLSHYRRGLPLARGVSDYKTCNIFHLHWPEAYLKKNRLSLINKFKYLLDLNLAIRHRKFFLTAHNLFPHNRHQEFGIPFLIKKTFHLSHGIFVHSDFARDQIVKTFGINKDKCWIIPHGDYAQYWSPPKPKDEARKILKLDPETKICLIFGTISPYKGSDKVLEYWVQKNPNAQLIIIGPILSQKFAIQLKKLALNNNNIKLIISDKWLKDDELHLWLSAVDCSIFNYNEIFTSGAATLARSMGVPILIPQRLKAVDLHEPHPLVHRFESLDSDFEEKLAIALNQSPNYDLASDWRKATQWEVVAKITKEAYETVLKNK